MSRTIIEQCESASVNQYGNDDRFLCNNKKINREVSWSFCAVCQLHSRFAGAQRRSDFGSPGKSCCGKPEIVSPETELPHDANQMGGIDRAVTFIRVAGATAVRGVTTGQALVDQSVIDARMAICSACQHLRTDWLGSTSCALCTCHVNQAQKLANKLAHAASECPILKWRSVE